MQHPENGFRNLSTFTKVIPRWQYFSVWNYIKPRTWKYDGKSKIWLRQSMHAYEKTVPPISLWSDLNRQSLRLI